MFIYYASTVLGLTGAWVAGSRGLPGREDVLRPKRKGVSAIAVLAVATVFVTVAGLRYRIGTDYGQYEKSYPDKYSQFSWATVEYDNEPGLSALATFGSYFYDAPVTMFVLAALVTVGLMLRTYATYSPLFAFSVLLMVISGAWHGSFNGVRQFIAAAIVLAAHDAVVKRRFWLYLLLVGAASLFHFSAWICLLFYFLPRRQMGWLGIVAVVALAAVAIASYDQLGSAMDTLRGDDVSTTAYFAEQVNPLRIILAFVPFIAYLLFARSARMSSRGHLYANIMLVNGVAMLIASSSAYLARFTIYTNVFIPLAVAHIVMACSRKNRIWIVPLVVVIYSIFWYEDVAPIPELNPFRWIWSKDV